MALTAGSRLGPYEIQSAIGAGGMGEVHKARDTRLDRSVAIKVLPQALATDPDRRCRFEREGDPREPDTQIGPLVNHDALTRITALVEDAVAKGAKVVAGGRARDDCFEPTVLTGVTREMRIYSEESFGPVVAIVTVNGVEEAVRVANDTEYGLALQRFSRPAGLGQAPVTIDQCLSASRADDTPFAESSRAWARPAYPQHSFVDGNPTRYRSYSSGVQLREGTIEC